MPRIKADDDFMESFRSTLTTIASDVEGHLAKARHEAAEKSLAERQRLTNQFKKEYTSLEESLQKLQSHVEEEDKKSVSLQRRYSALLHRFETRTSKFHWRYRAQYSMKNVFSAWKTSMLLTRAAKQEQSRMTKLLTKAKLARLFHAWRGQVMRGQRKQQSENWKASLAAQLDMQADQHQEQMQQMQSQLSEALASKRELEEAYANLERRVQDMFRKGLETMSTEAASIFSGAFSMGSMLRPHGQGAAVREVPNTLPPSQPSQGSVPSYSVGSRSVHGSPSRYSQPGAASHTHGSSVASSPARSEATSATPSRRTEAEEVDTPAYRALQRLKEQAAVAGQAASLSATSTWFGFGGAERAPATAQEGFPSKGLPQAQAQAAPISAVAASHSSAPAGGPVRAFPVVNLQPPAMPQPRNAMRDSLRSIQSTGSTGSEPQPSPSPPVPQPHPTPGRSRRGSEVSAGGRSVGQFSATKSYTSMESQYEIVNGVWRRM